MSEAVFEGYHGSSATCAEAIVASGEVQPSLGKDHWYGQGAYFFIDGVSDPLENARDWAVAQSWCKDERKNRYSVYAVVKARVTSKSDHVLDMRQVENASVFEQARRLVVQKLSQGSRRTKYYDSMVFDYLAHHLLVDVFIGNQYIKFSVHRINGMKSRLPNVTMLCARKSDRVVIENLEIAAKGNF